jgi:hypothetical protein
MSKLSDEDRAKLLVELDKAVTEVKALSSKIRGITNSLESIANAMSNYIFSYADRRPGLLDRETPPWEPSDFDLSQLKKDYARLQELVARRDDLEKQLGITITSRP